MLNGTFLLEGLRDMGKLTIVASFIGYFIEGARLAGCMFALISGGIIWLVGCMEKES
ncbi:hypothetical protein SAMN05660831_00096 [Thiohalospira halophila DSM 15071]|uniref:Uncharacterized protein n=1 Tax=Thiohalospira halophila DSM 15071 TaxID=1123397 RepID=A0A1I1NC50_9GAMM|nr:hypothetical protein [Thiohalospira halophila]SFC92353.1 hypothetical protein SAMN05660831_00096 [Thiohalospira halophila DSM 15071]